MKRCILQPLEMSGKETSKIMVKRDEHDRFSRGGVAFTDKGVTPARQGTVLAAGESKQLKDGDRVLFTDYAGNIVNIKGEEIYIVHEKLILAVLS